MREIQELMFVVGSVVAASSLVFVVITALLLPAVMRGELHHTLVSRLPIMAGAFFLLGMGIVVLSPFVLWLMPEGIVLVAAGAYLAHLAWPEVRRLIELRRP